MVTQRDGRYGPRHEGHPDGDDPIALLDRILAMNEHDSGEMRRAFHQELDAIDDAFVAAGLRITEQMPRLTGAFMAGDRSVIDQADALAAEVADACEAIDDAGFVLLARQSPVGGDLRRLVALLRMTVDVNRSASLLRHAIRTLRNFDPRFLAEPVRSQLGEMATRSCDVFSAGLDAWRRRDALAVTDIDHMDSNVDELQVSLLRETTDTGDEIGEGMLVLGLLARYFERIADHGVEIARDAAFVATGQRVRVGRRRREAQQAGDAGRRGDGREGSSGGHEGPYQWPPDDADDGEVGGGPDGSGHDADDASDPDGA